MFKWQNKMSTTDSQMAQGEKKRAMEVLFISVPISIKILEKLA